MIQIDSIWWLLPLFIISIGVSIWFYRVRLSPRLLHYGLIVLRSTSIFLLLLLFLSPILKCSKKKTIDPKTIVLLDNSKSIKNYNQVLPAHIIEYTDRVKAELNAEPKVFDKDVFSIDSFHQLGNRTNIFSALNTISEIYQDENLKRIVLITDGNYNAGNNPIFYENSQLARLDVLLIGDTTQIEDLRVENIEQNPIMLSGEINIVNAIVSGYNIPNSIVKVNLLELTNNGNKLIETKSIPSSPNFFSKNIQFKIINPAQGKHHYRVQVVEGSKEKNLRNNYKDFFVDVVDGTKQIEILSNFPHPDISAIKSMLEINKSFKVKLTLSDGNPNFSDKSDLLILYQIPNNYTNGKQIIDRAKLLGKSVLFMLGTQTNYNSFNQIQSSYKANVKGNIMQDYFPVFNTTFAKFYLKESTTASLPTLPPLSNYLINIEPTKEAHHLFLAKIGKIETSQPLVSMGYQDNMHIGVIAAENIWKWKLNNYLAKKNSEDVQDILEKIVNYLAVKKDKKQLVSQISETVNPENSDFVISANTYNELYQPFKATNIRCVITGENNFVQTYDMLPKENSYSLTPRGLKAGNFHYKIEATIAGKKFEDGGKFAIFKEDIEDFYLPANYEEMNSLAIKNSGQLYLWKDRNALLQTPVIDNYKAKMVEETTRMKANDIVWLLLGLLSLLAVEWLVRKYFGQL